MVEVVIRLAARALVANSQIRPSAASVVSDMRYTAKLVSRSVIELNLFIIFRYV
jgi:hypothetical protein